MKLTNGELNAARYHIRALVNMVCEEQLRQFGVPAVCFAGIDENGNWFKNGTHRLAGSVTGGNKALLRARYSGIIPFIFTQNERLSAEMYPRRAKVRMDLIPFHATLCGGMVEVYHRGVHVKTLHIVPLQDLQQIAAKMHMVKMSVAEFLVKHGLTPNLLHHPSDVPEWSTGSNGGRTGIEWHRGADFSFDGVLYTPDGARNDARTEDMVKAVGYRALTAADAAGIRIKEDSFIGGKRGFIVLHTTIARKVAFARLLKETLNDRGIRLVHSGDAEEDLACQVDAGIDLWAPKDTPAARSGARHVVSAEQPVHDYLNALCETDWGIQHNLAQRNGLWIPMNRRYTHSL